MPKIIIDLDEYQELKQKALICDQYIKNNRLFSVSKIINDSVSDFDYLEIGFILNAHAIDSLKSELEKIKLDIDKFIESKNVPVVEQKLNWLKNLSEKIKLLYSNK